MANFSKGPLLWASHLSWSKRLPCRLINHKDFLSFHHCTKRIREETMVAFGKKISTMTVYPSANQMVHILDRRGV